MAELNDRARERLRQEKDRLKLSEREIGDLIQWHQSRVSTKLTGRTPMTLDELDALCFALNMLPTEAVRDHGMEFCAELTPTELRIVQKVQTLTPAQKDALLVTLGIPKGEARRATPKKPLPRGRE